MGRRWRDKCGAALLDRIACGGSSSKATMVELVRLYSNPNLGSVRFGRLSHDALSQRRLTAEPPARLPQRVVQRLGAELISRIVDEYASGTSTVRRALRYLIGKGTVRLELRIRCGPTSDLRSVARPDSQLNLDPDRVLETAST